MGPYVHRSIRQGEERWLMNPFIFLRESLGIPVLLTPDTTTQNGRRLAMVHIDGDGFVNQGEWYNAPIAGKVMLEAILKKYEIPTTVSVIQGEIAKNGVFPQNYKHYESIAREIFALPWIELASHTYSHPFDWQILARNPKAPNMNMKIKGYQFNLDSELIGSLKYINETLAPVNKKSNIIFWSGNANPTEAALSILEQHNIMNINGGDTDITKANPSLTHISPLGIEVGPYFQVFAPVANENIYTNEWTGPFWGFQRAIETFQLTDAPRRLKPIDIYYHFYSASKQASLTALQRVYDWVLTQAIFPLYMSDYYDIAMSARQFSLAKIDKDSWKLNNGSVKEIRIDDLTSYPDLLQSKNVLGFSDYNQSRYIHLGPSQQSRLVMTDHPPKTTYLMSSNSSVKLFSRERHHLRFRFDAKVGLIFRLANATQCVVNQDGTRLHPSESKQSNQLYKLSKKGIVDIDVRC